MKRFLVVFAVLGGLAALALNFGGIISTPAARVQNDEAAVRAALCEIENGNFKAAQAMLEAVLKKDPQNIYARRLLPGAAARQIRDGDRSPENLALVRRAADAYERAAADPLLKNERADIFRYLASLYGRLGEEEKTAALLKKAADESIEPPQRAMFYTALAADRFACANEISGAPAVKSIVKKGGREVYAFRRPTKAADFEKLKNCAAQGSAWIEKAVALDPESDTVWSYRASLLIQLARIAEMENRPAEKERLTKEYESARDRFRALLDKRRDAPPAIDDGKPTSPLDVDLSFPPVELTDAQFEELRRELASYRAEKTLAETIERVDIPFELVAPIAPDEDAPPEPPAAPSRPNAEKRKTEWKTFAPDGRFSAFLPADVSYSSSATGRIYEASGDGISFFILENAHSKELAETEHDAALNVLAHIFVKYFGDQHVARGRPNDRFEANLVGKERIDGRTARFYAYRTISCREHRKGAMIFAVGRNNSYLINVYGADEKDARVASFIKSLKLD